jgi:hypothetical protein
MMDEPERLLDQTTSALERALLKEGRAYRAPDDLRAHTLAALGVATSAGLASGALAWLSAKSWTAKIVLALSTVTLLAAIPLGHVLLGGDAPPPRATPVVVLPPMPAASRALPLPAPSIAVAAPAPVMDPPAALAPAPTRVSANTNSALRAELAALDAVRSTLANDDPTGALSFLAAYFRTFPRGRLHPEAEVLRIDALSKAGQSDVAKRHAQEFLKRHPNSVLTARVRPYAGR